MRSFIVCMLFIVVAACAHAKGTSNPPVDFNGRWKNDMGSELVFIVKDGLVRGQYFTNVGEPEKSKFFPLSGQVAGDQIVFTVNFKGYGSLTAWVGQVTKYPNGDSYLRTMWHNTKDIKDTNEKENIWGSIRTGASNFTRVELP